MRILVIGDIIGSPGRRATKEAIRQIKNEQKIDCVIANGENLSHGIGMTKKNFEEMREAGIDFFTSGNHILKKPDIFPEMEKKKVRIIRPANFPPGVPGRGWTIVTSASGAKIAVINLLGRVFMRYNVDCPFRSLKEIVQEAKKVTDIIVVDFHAEATSEKMAMGFFMDGEVSAVVGTHTHIQTADEKILPKGTAYITDLGMTGAYDSVIGQKKEIIIQRFLTSMPLKFEIATDNVWLHGAVISVDEKTGRAQQITRIQRRSKE